MQEREPHQGEAEEGGEQQRDWDAGPRPDGTIRGLGLNSANPALVVRNYSPTSGGQMPIRILQGMSMDSNANLQFQLDGNSWGSTISFDTGAAAYASVNRIPSLAIWSRLGVVKPFAPKQPTSA